PLLIKDSIYMSFYYQPQGRGNAPEEADRLTLEFYAPALDQWFHMWSTNGESLESFYNTHGVSSLQVLIPLTDSVKFFHPEFKFRFHNFASLAGNNQPDWQANCDHWNVDLVWIDKDRTVTDSSFRKIAFVNKPPSMIKHYQAMPYRQYKNDPTNSMKDTIHSIIIRNLDDVTYVSNYRYEISNQTTQESLYDGGSADVEPFKDAGFVEFSRFRDPSVISFFSIYNETKKSYTITHVINDIGLTGVGDTAIRVQEFSNYYAYDDGTAEAGYGMSIKNGRAAMKFKLNTKDTLRQVQFYFNPTLTGANEQYFDLMIWKNLDPEELIYTKRIKPVFTQGYYTFHTFDLDTSIVLANEFYIGFRQLKAENLNIGFDYAIDSKDYLFYNIGEGWNNSIFSGSLMIRPVFGEKMPAGLTQIAKKITNFTIYPNPLNSSNLHFDLQEGDVRNYQLEIYNITGQILLSTKLTTTVDVSILKNGVYLIRLINTENGSSDTQKLIIKR
ncbi:MAG: T9SS type A sorting domain-containing protein, partial [Bacteroidales bacterium]|nr:T9SS type A sorting domain-containing protein [Bacteroidales bacterium]